MSDLVERLRNYSEGPTSYWEPICSEAADRIEELEIELETANHDQAWQLDHISGIEFKIEELENPWISVDDRLPDSMNRSCLSYDGAEISWAFYTSDGKWVIGNSFFEDITHWQPLPPPPEKAE